MKITIVATVTFVLAELLSRLFIAGPFDCLEPSADPEIMYRLRPGSYRADGWYEKIGTFEINVDSLGCRMARQPPSVAGSERGGVLFLGDSMTFGFGVDDEASFPAQSAALLLEAGAGVRVRNCGVPGYNLVQNVRAAELLVPRTRPTVVVLMVHSTDVETAVDLSLLEPRGPLLGWLTRHVRLARFFYIAMVVQLGLNDSLVPGRLTAGEIGAAVERIGRLAQRYDCSVILCTIDDWRPPGTDFERVAAEFGLATVELPTLAADRPYFVADDAHWSELGNGVVARRLLPELLSRLSVSYGQAAVAQ